MCMTGQLCKPNGLEGNLVRNGPGCCGDCRRSVSSTPPRSHHAHPDLSKGGRQPVVSAKRFMFEGQQVTAADCHLQAGFGLENTMNTVGSIFDSVIALRCVVQDVEEIHRSPVMPCRSNTCAKLACKASMPDHAQPRFARHDCLGQQLL